MDIEDYCTGDDVELEKLDGASSVKMMIAGLEGGECTCEVGIGDLKVAFCWLTAVALIARLVWPVISG